MSSSPPGGNPSKHIAIRIPNFSLLAPQSQPPPTETQSQGQRSRTLKANNAPKWDNPKNPYRSPVVRPPPQVYMRERPKTVSFSQQQQQQRSFHTGHQRQRSLSPLNNKSVSPRRSTSTSPSNSKSVSPSNLKSKSTPMDKPKVEVNKVKPNPTRSSLSPSRLPLPLKAKPSLQWPGTYKPTSAPGQWYGMDGVLALPLVQHQPQSYERSRGHHNFYDGMEMSSNNEKLSLKQVRRWEYTTLGRLVQDGGYKSPLGDSTRFTYMSYNVLSPQLLTAHRYLYSDCNPQALDLDYRRYLLFRELDDLSPSIVCFQEVEEEEFRGFFSMEMERRGYKGLYKKRTGDKVDGCSVYWKHSMFTLIDYLSVEYSQSKVGLLDRDNIGLLVKLQSKFGRRPKVVVGTTHILYNPKRMDIKLAQVQVLLAELDRFAFCGVDKDGLPLYHSMVLGGDFNTEPYSPIIRLITDGQFQYADPDGHIPQIFTKKGLTSVLPSNLGITDQCQHLGVALERLKKWKSTKRNYFELELDSRLVNLKKTVLNPRLAANFDQPTLFDPSLIQQLNEIQKVTFGGGELTHKLNLRNAYYPRLDRREGTDDLATTKQIGWVCVDYVFYGSLQWLKDRQVEGPLKLLRRLGLPSRSECREVGPFPSLEAPSDHLPLVAEFLLK